MNFDRIAPYYGLMESGMAGPCLKRCREAFLGDIPAPVDVLMIGEGHGRFLSEFRRRFPNTSITVVDGSEVMLGIAKAALADAEKVDFVHSMIEDWETGKRFDLIVTNFMLDCVGGDRMSQVIAHIASFAKPGANWLVADFNEASGGPAKWRSRFIISLLYLFFRKVAGIESRSLHPWDEFIIREGFVLHRGKSFSWKLLKSEWWLRP
jgi:ubiquinone/menaquinone biosynthesis C-methylase UbiE